MTFRISLPPIPAVAPALAGVALLLVLALPGPARAMPDGPAAAVEAMAVADRVMHALDLLGTPYRRRGSEPATGFDCSGFVGHVFRAANGIALPRTARDMFALAADQATDVAREALAPGDLLFFRIGRLGQRVDHVGLYLGDGRFVHAPASGGEVRIDGLDLPYWQQHYAGARRVVLPAAAHKDDVSGDGQTVVAVAPDTTGDPMP